MHDVCPNIHKVKEETYFQIFTRRASSKNKHWVPLNDMNDFFTGITWNYDEAWSAVHIGFRRAQVYLACIFLSPANHEKSSIEAHERQKMNVAQFAENVRKFGDGEYINDGYAPSPDWKENFWGANYEKLLRVKIKYDPDNLFYCHHCVGSDLEKKGDEFESSAAPTNVTQRLPVLLLLIIAISIDLI